MITIQKTTRITEQSSKLAGELICFNFEPVL